MMAPEEARERITAVRAQLDDLMRAVSVPDVDWMEAFWIAQCATGSLEDLQIRLLANGLCGLRETRRAHAGNDNELHAGQPLLIA